MATTKFALPVLSVVSERFKFVPFAAPAAPRPTTTDKRSSQASTCDSPPLASAVVLAVIPAEQDVDANLALETTLREDDPVKMRETDIRCLSPAPVTTVQKDGKMHPGEDYHYERIVPQ